MCTRSRRVAFQPHEDSACGGSCLCTVAAKRYCIQWGTACRNYLLDTQCKHYPSLSSCSSTAIHDVHEASGTSHSDVSPSFSSSASEHYFGALMLCVTMDGRNMAEVVYNTVLRPRSSGTSKSTICKWAQAQGVDVEEASSVKNTECSAKAKAQNTCERAENS